MPAKVMAEEAAGTKATRVTFPSDGQTIVAELYGSLPATRAAILVHGASWDASGWHEIAPRFASGGVPALAVNLRGFGGSGGKTNRYQPGKQWTPVADLRSAKALLRERGVSEIALVGSSMGGSAALVSTFDGDVEAVVALSAPVAAVPADLAKMITGRKLFVCAERDSLRAAPNVAQCFKDTTDPKTLILFGGREHSRAMFTAPYAEEAIGAIVEFVCRRA